jgi:hypothetical protein
LERILWAQLWPGVKCEDAEVKVSSKHEKLISIFNRNIRPIRLPVQAIVVLQDLHGVVIFVISRCLFNFFILHCLVPILV